MVPRLPGSETWSKIKVKGEEREEAGDNKGVLRTRMTPWGVSVSDRAEKAESERTRGFKEGISIKSSEERKDSEQI